MQIDEVAVPHSDFAWVSNATVYTDGSCKYVNDLGISVAASAAVQISPNGQRMTATLAISAEYPRSAVVAEHTAVFVASFFVQPGFPIVVANDCQAVVQGAAQTMEDKLNYRKNGRVLGDDWRADFQHV